MTLEPGEFPFGFDRDKALAAIDAIGRTGARDVSVAHDHDDGRWSAWATYQKQKVGVSGFGDPSDALDALVRRLLVGGYCTHCRRVVAVGFVGRLRPDRCLWHRSGRRWMRGCERATT